MSAWNLVPGYGAGVNSFKKLILFSSSQRRVAAKVSEVSPSRPTMMSAITWMPRARTEGAELRDVGQHVVDRAGAEGPPVVGLDRAVLAGVGAAAREEDRPEEVLPVEPTRAEGFGLEEREAPPVDRRQVPEVVPAG